VLDDHRVSDAESVHLFNGVLDRTVFVAGMDVVVDQGHEPILTQQKSDAMAVTTGRDDSGARADSHSPRWRSVPQRYPKYKTRIGCAKVG
jgi:hypothetical protein